MIEPTAGSATTRRSLPTSRGLVVALVALLAVAIGAVAGSFLMTGRATGMGAGASYVPADVAMYFELRAIPSADQDAALREFLAHFPVTGLDADRPLIDQVADRLDEALSDGDLPFSYEEDVAPWWDGRVAMAVTDYPSMTESMSGAMPGFTVLFGVTDAAAAGATADRLRAEAESEGAAFSSTEHRGTTVWSFSDAAQPFAYALAADQLILGASLVDVQEALDVRSGEGDALAASEEVQRLAFRLPDDYIAFGFTSVEAIIETAEEDLAALAPEMAGLYEALLAGQPKMGLMAVTMTADRMTFSGVGDAPTGAFAAENHDRGLASAVPGDALVYVDGGNVGTRLSKLVEAAKSAANEVPEAAEQLAQIEAALGAELEELVEWIGDAALVIGSDGSEPYAGLVITPTDADAAQRRLDQLSTLAGLAAFDGSTDVTVTEETVAGATVTTIELAVPDPFGGFGMPMAPETGIALQYTLGDDRVLIGLGEFVERSLLLEAGTSLADDERFRGAVESVGGFTNAGTAWLNLAGTRETIETAVGLMLPPGMMAGYETDVQPWLLPLDYLVGVSMLDGEAFVQDGALVVR
ncbi:MAG: DUF3352 domain-containing protein [Candidatus Limnocylindria bacterium]